MVFPHVACSVSKSRLASSLVVNRHSQHLHPYLIFMMEQDYVLVGAMGRMLVGSKLVIIGVEKNILWLVVHLLLNQGFLLIY